MRTYVERDTSGVEILVREGRAEVTAVAPHEDLQGIRVELLVENPPEIHPAIQIFLTPVVEVSDPVVGSAETFATSGQLVSYRMEWRRNPGIDPSTPISEISEDDLALTLATLVADTSSEVESLHASEAWSLPSA